jgi:hypothetical protein
MTRQSKPALQRSGSQDVTARQQQGVEPPHDEGGHRSVDRKWGGFVMAAGIIVMLAALLLLGKLTLVPLLHLLRALALCCVLLLLIPFRFTAHRLGLERLEWVLLNVLGIGPLVFSTGLALNFLVHGEERCATHGIVGATFSELFYRVELEGGHFSAFPGAREFQTDITEQTDARSMRICTARGLFGADVVTERALLDH